MQNDSDQRNQMLRENALTVDDKDSDQSLSEENVDADWNQNCVSLGGLKDMKEMQVISQPNVLWDGYELALGSKAILLPQKRPLSFYDEDDVEIPVFDNDGCITCSTRMASSRESLGVNISDDKNERVEPWLEVRREAEALVHVIGMAGCSSSGAILPKENKYYEGHQGKSKSKFSFRFQSRKSVNFHNVGHKDEPNIPEVLTFSEDAEPVESNDVEYLSSSSGCWEGSHGEEIEESKIIAVPGEGPGKHNYVENSMALLVDTLKQKNGYLQWNSPVINKAKERRTQLDVKKSTCQLGDKALDNDEAADDLDSAPYSDDDVLLGGENNSQGQKLFIPESSGRTMADQFQEAFGTALTNNEGTHFVFPGKSFSGLFGKLQRVMQDEKELDKVFLNRIQMEASVHETSLDVRILSKSLEAKVTVCSCSLIRGSEVYLWNHRLTMDTCLVDFHEMKKKSGGMAMKIVFSSRICSDVELEVGNLIHIHSPWKEVNVMGKDETIILATYFSSISS